MVSRRSSGRPPAALHDEPARWVTSARFLLRSLSLRGPAFLLALLAVTVGATVIATVLNLKSGLDQKMSRELRAYGPNLLVRPAAGDEATFDEAIALRLPGVLGAGARLAPELLAGGVVQDQGATFVGTDFARLRLLYPGWRVEPPDAGIAPGVRACVLGASVAARTALKPGDAADLRLGIATTLPVAGILSSGEAEDEQVFVPLSVLQELTGLRGRLSLATISIEGGNEAVEGAAAKLESVFPEVQSRPLTAIARTEGAILGRINRMMFLLTLVIVALSGLCLVTTLMSMVVERESEIGLARAIGAGDGEIFRMFLGEVGLVGFFGAVAGTAFGAGLVRLIGVRLFGAAIEPRLAVVPVVLLASFLICLIAVVLPLRRALRIQPAAALRGD